MKVLILNGERKGEEVLNLLNGVIERAALGNGWQADSIMLRDKRIARCTGCFGCWTKTPGLCLINDYGRELAEKAVRSDLLVYLTAVTFGGYSSELKKAIDRFACPMLLPFFTTIGGAVHHKPRYNPLPGLIGIGVLPGPREEDERIFSDLIARNSINLHSPKSGSAVFYLSMPPEELEEGVRSLLGGTGK